MDDLISRQAAIDEIQEYWRSLNLRRRRIPLAAEAVYMDLKGVVATLPSAEPQPSDVARDIATILENEQDIRVILKNTEPQQWISVTERLPENTNPVNITWVNHEPEPYYSTIKDKPFTATGCYCDGKWYWYSVTCQDYLDEYRYCDVDSMDESIEVTAWMPLPEPYKGGDE